MAHHAQRYFMLAIAFALSTAQAEKPAKFRIRGDAAQGKVLFETLCVCCHGTLGDGKGPVGVRIQPALPDFTNSEPMFARNSTLSNQQIHDVIAYLKTFARGLARATPPAKEKRL